MKPYLEKCDLRKIKVAEGVFFLLIVFCLLLWIGSPYWFENSFKSVVTLEDLTGQKAFAGQKDAKEVFDDIELPNDTLIVLDTTAAPGETFWLTVSLTNKTIPVAGVSFLLVIDSLSLISPVYDTTNPCYPNPPCTTFEITGYETDRLLSFPHEPENPYMVWGGRLINNHIDTLKFSFLTNILYYSPKPCLPKGGYGPILRFKFVVNPNATPGHTTDMHFLFTDPSTGGFATTLVDTIGEDNFIPQRRKGVFTVAGGGGPGNNCPVFASSMPLDAYQINEGATLQFDVRSTDADGDSITLSLSSFSPSPPGANYHFATKKGASSVTQTFDYTPGFDEAPVTRTAIFRAVDEHGCERTKTVSIQVNDTPQDMLIAGSQEGGVPASTGILVPFTLSSTVDIYGFQFAFQWDHTKLDVDSIVGTQVINGFSMYTNLGDSAGKATVLVFGLGGQTISAGLDTVVYAAFSVHSDAPAVEVPITLENAREAINPGYPSKALAMVNGKFTIDMFGDVNLDQLVDVADVVSLVAYILGDISFTPRKSSAADVNRDSVLNVGDLVAMIDIILGRWMGPSPPLYTGPMADVRLDYKNLQMGNSGEVKVMANLQVPVAGAQLRISYDPGKVSFQAPRVSERSDHFILQYRDDGKGELNLVLYNFSNDPISTGDGNILSIPAMVSPEAQDGFEIELQQVVLSDEKAVLIPVEGQSPSVPTAFELSQNYPNPFNPSTTIKFTLPSPQAGVATLSTTLKIYNVLGEVVRTLLDKPMAPGVYHEIWDGRDDHDNQVASGIYFYRLRAGDFEDTKKMVLMK
jgi:hypothetical protein